ncbi:MAG: 4a-hydroxytetrahydrobiopterin dehydratase [Pirellulales bacterium]
MAKALADGWQTVSPILTAGQASSVTHSERRVPIVQPQSTEQLVAKKCLPCEGGVDRCPLDVAHQQLKQLAGWQLTHDGQRIRKEWTVKNFMAGIDFFQRVAELAEADGHHPDLHLEGYRNVAIELWTHAIGGLSENDFILAAKIDQLPIDGTAK